jgi:hypothetical protein
LCSHPSKLAIDAPGPFLRVLLLRAAAWRSIRLPKMIHDYFAVMQLPDVVTIYHRLVLSLRPKDIIATFNWDPFLFEACRRNYRHAPMPRVIFLHGSVAVGYCTAHRRKGPRASACPECGNPFDASRLLYPIGKKDYSSDPFIAAKWSGMRGALASAFAITIFGYGALTSARYEKSLGTPALVPRPACGKAPMTRLGNRRGRSL